MGLAYPRVWRVPERPRAIIQLLWKDAQVAPHQVEGIQRSACLDYVAYAFCREVKRFTKKQRQTKITIVPRELWWTSQIK